MLEGRRDILRAMAKRRVFLVVMAYNEYTTDIPEHAHLEPRVFWDRRARGLGGKPVSCAEENLLGYPRDPYATENILLHEFAHGVHLEGMAELDPTFDRRLEAAYDSAKAAGLWEGTYAISNKDEYWAEAVQSWFDDNRESDALHNHVDTRAELLEYDPKVARLCREVFGNGQWRYTKPELREPAGRAHLVDFDPSRAPTFRWRDEPLPDKPRVLIQTELGDIEVELDAKRAPATTANFCRYVHQGLYDDGVFFRTVRADNQPDDPVRIAVLQGRADETREAEFFPPIPLERTRDTGLLHLDGTLTMGRLGPDTATHHVVICVGDQPHLDFGGRRNPDGQGFAAFGRVVSGMDLVRKIHQRPADGQQLAPPVRIQRMIRRH